MLGKEPFGSAVFSGLSPPWWNILPGTRHPDKELFCQMLPVISHWQEASGLFSGSLFFYLPVPLLGINRTQRISLIPMFTHMFVSSPNNC